MSLGVHKDRQGVSLPGKHNRQSALAKSSVLQIRGVSPSAIGGGNALLVGLSFFVLSKLTGMNFDVDGVAMARSTAWQWAPLWVHSWQNAFLCSIEEKLDQDNKLPEFYRRYVDDTFATMKNVPAAEDFLSTLNSCHPSINFTMELASDNRLPFIGMEVLKKGCKLETSVYRKPTNTGLLLHHQSHVDKRYKKSLLKTMLNRAFHLSSTWESLKSGCDHLKMMFTNFKYPDSLIKSTISHFFTSVRSGNPGEQAQLSTNENAVHRVVLPFKDQKSADAVKRQLSDLSSKIDHTLQLVFKSRKICEDLKMCEPKPPIISQQCVVYNYKCDLCDAEYVGYTSRHLHQRIDEHRYSAIGKHLKNDHGLETIGDLSNNFSVLKKCNGKLDCLIYEMLFIKKKRPCLNTQSDSIRAKLFI